MANLLEGDHLQEQEQQEEGEVVDGRPRSRNQQQQRYHQPELVAEAGALVPPQQERGESPPEALPPGHGAEPRGPLVPPIRVTHDINTIGHYVSRGLVRAVNEIDDVMREDEAYFAEQRALGPVHPVGSQMLTVARKVPVAVATAKVAWNVHKKVARSQTFFGAFYEASVRVACIWMMMIVFFLDKFEDMKQLLPARIKHFMDVIDAKIGFELRRLDYQISEIFQWVINRLHFLRMPPESFWGGFVEWLDEVRRYFKSLSHRTAPIVDLTAKYIEVLAFMFGPIIEFVFNSAIRSISAP